MQKKKKNRSCFLGFPFNVGFSVHFLHIEDNTLLWCSCQADPPPVCCRLFHVFMSSPERRTHSGGIAEQNVPSHSFTGRERETLEGVTSRWYSEDSRRRGRRASRCAMLPRTFGPDRVKLPWSKQSRRPLSSCPP